MTKRGKGKGEPGKHKLIHSFTGTEGTAPPGEEAVPPEDYVMLPALGLQEAYSAGLNVKVPTHISAGNAQVGSPLGAKIKEKPL